MIREEKEFLRASEEFLRKVQSKEVTGLASCVALMEIKWALYERKEYAKADRAVSLIEEIAEIASVDKEIAKEAIDLKIKEKTELLDSIHVVTAVMNGAFLVTGDDDLRSKVEDIVPVKTPQEVLQEISR